MILAKFSESPSHEQISRSRGICLRSAESQLSLINILTSLCHQNVFLRLHHCSLVAYKCHSHVSVSKGFAFHVNTRTVDRCLFCTLANKSKIISQMITLLHVSTLSCHPQGACNQYLASLYNYRVIQNDCRGFNNSFPRCNPM